MSNAPTNWGQGEEVQSSWFKFEKVGDAVYGTLVSRRLQPGTDGFQDQWIYELKDPSGNMVNVAVRANKTGTVSRLNKLQTGERVGIIFDKEIPPSKKGYNPTKALSVKSFGVDEEFFNEQDPMDVPPPFEG